MLRFERFKRTRFWAVYIDEELICLTVYKKGAREVIRRLKKEEPCLT